MKLLLSFLSVFNYLTAGYTDVGSISARQSSPMQKFIGN
jgi:hypothetical protein